MSSINKPIFILGNPRSGTTLLRLMISSHNSIVIAPECSFIEWWYNKYKGWTINSNIDHFVYDLMISKKIEFWRLDEHKLKSRLKLVKPDSYSELCKQIYIEYAESIQLNFEYWGDKNNHYVTCPELLLKLYPDAYFIHIIRNVKDVYCSYKELNKNKSISKYSPHLPSSIQEITRDWNTNNNRVLNFFDSLTDNHISIRYEDLVLKPKITLSNICNLLHLDFEDKMINYNDQNNSKNFEPEEYNKWKGLNKTDLTSSRINRYKDLISDSENASLNEFCKELLIKYNY